MFSLFYFFLLTTDVVMVLFILTGWSLLSPDFWQSEKRGSVRNLHLSKTGPRQHVNVFTDVFTSVVVGFLGTSEEGTTTFLRLSFFFFFLSFFIRIS